MSEQSMFNQPDQGTNQPQPEQQADQASLFKVGDRTYDAESASKKIESADAFIEQLKQEKQDLQSQFQQAQEQLQQSTKLDEALTMFNQQNQPPAQPQVNESQAPIDMDALKLEMAQQANQQALAVFKQQQAAMIQQSNYDQSLAKAQSTFGDEFASKLQQRGTELGLDTAGIDNLAKTNPAMFNELFIPKVSDNAPSPRSQFTGHNVQQNPEKAKAPDITSMWSTAEKLQAIEEYAKTLPKQN